MSDFVELGKMIDEYLLERRHSSGGWAEVLTEDVHKLSAIIQKLVEMKFDRDPDGDLPIEWKLIDRTRFERLYYRPVPYDVDRKDKKKHRKVFETILDNQRIALGEMMLFVDMERIEER